MKIHFGLGGNKLPGWRNWDNDCDLRKPLPYSTGIVTHIFVERGIEQITHQEAWKFFEECFRILKPAGLIRVAVPDISQMWPAMTAVHRKSVQAVGYGDGTSMSIIRAALFEHGHQAVWNSDLLETIMSAIGFTANKASAGESFYPEFVGLESRWKAVGKAAAEAETAVVEGVKL